MVVDQVRQVINYSASETVVHASFHENQQNKMVGVDKGVNSTWWLVEHMSSVSSMFLNVGMLTTLLLVIIVIIN